MTEMRNLGAMENDGYTEIYGRKIPITFRGFDYYIERSRTILEYLDQENTLVLDLGSGNSSFGPVVNSSSTKFKASVARLDRSYADQRPWQADFAIAGEAQALPFFDKSFDLIVSNHMLRHFSVQEMAPMLRESMRVLKADGQMHIRPLRSAISSETMSMVYDELSVNEWETLIVTRPEDYDQWSSQEVEIFNNFIAESCTLRTFPPDLDSANY